MFDDEAMNFDDIFEEYYDYGQQIKQYVTDTSVILNDALDQGKRVLFEGAQGVMLDIDQGTYPFVTSSNPVAGGVTIGSGVGPAKINKVVGVCKAYTSRVGDGPFPTELNDEVGNQIREVGLEYELNRCKPVYEELPGWSEDITGCRTLADLPENARNYVRRVSELVGVRISTFSVGPDRTQTNILESVWAQI